MKLCSHHKKRPGESCACMNQWLSVAACLCCFLMDRYDGNSYLYPGLSRLGIHHLASILSAYASANTKQVCHICCMDVCCSSVLCFKFRRVIQKSNPDNTNQCQIPSHSPLYALWLYCRHQFSHSLPLNFCLFATRDTIPVAQPITQADLLAGN